ncbi:hypothetical protein M378DRAFT_154849 [Amanita muscaria Koide BX008]|uniref:Uncharacterized protein n=1 Tax=Amanita muscaria (strain Koide BX008) TaxID=946122 RepID=A0A0C2XQ35_AMAMK|nr:hypothetical protein M378DRAFT_154849 [Amanita muscaria Koide BX008]
MMDPSAGGAVNTVDKHYCTRTASISKVLAPPKKSPHNPAMFSNHLTTSSDLSHRSILCSLESGLHL